MAGRLVHSQHQIQSASQGNVQQSYSVHYPVEMPIPEPEMGELFLDLSLEGFRRSLGEWLAFQPLLGYFRPFRFVKLGNAERLHHLVFRQIDQALPFFVSFGLCRGVLERLSQEGRMTWERVGHSVQSALDIFRLDVICLKICNPSCLAAIWFLQLHNLGEPLMV